MLRTGKGPCGSGKATKSQFKRLKPVQCAEARSRAAELRFKRHYLPFKVFSLANYESGIAERSVLKRGEKEQ